MRCLGMCDLRSGARFARPSRAQSIPIPEGTSACESLIAASAPSRLRTFALITCFTVPDQRVRRNEFWKPHVLLGSDTKYRLS
jgi:hypothetical protein